MKTISLWPDGTVMEYYPAEERRTDACVVVFPGGGYVGRAPHEGRGYAEYLNAIGMDAFVCEYRVKEPDPENPLYPWPLVDARRAVRWVRSHAAAYGVDPHKIAVMGSSAGGHLAASVSAYTGSLPGETHDETDAADCRPDATICRRPSAPAAPEMISLDKTVPRFYIMCFII